MKDKEQKSSRNIPIDILKGIAIVLVIVGHSIQCGSGVEYSNNQLFFFNRLFRLIYTFHMPLFMLISGYLFCFSIKKHDTAYIIKNKISKLIIPIFVWTFLYKCIAFFLHRIPQFNVFAILHESFYSMNFLWALFICILVTILIYKVYNNSWVAYVIVLALSLSCTNNNLDFFNFLLPFFLIDFEFNNHYDKIKKHLTKKNLIFILLGSLIAFLIMYKFFSYGSYIYTNSYSLVNNFNNLFKNLFRFVIGIFGSTIVCISVYLLKDFLKNFKLTQLIGRNSMGIYIISTYLANHLLVHITKAFTFSYLYVFIESLITLLVSLIIIFLLKRFKITKKLLLGE